MSSREHDYTLRIAEMALESIKALSLPADPPGYELWYNYASGRHPELNRRINRAIEANGSVSELELDGLYDEFLSSARIQAELERARSGVSREIDNIVDMLGEFILSTSEGRDQCADASRRLAHSTDRESIRAIADALVQALRSVEIRHVATEQRLSTAKQEIEALQQSLATVTVEASRDPVTGLVNRRGFNKAIEKACEHANSAGEPLCLLMLDIDHFKSFNDRFGHVMGDSVLSLVGVTLKQILKGQDVAARYGGEEFAVILPNTTAVHANVVAEQIREKIEGRELRKRSTGEGLGSITVSIGSASHRGGERPRPMIERADACLYEAKRAGRNCVRGEAGDPDLRDTAA